MSNSDFEQLNKYFVDASKNNNKLNLLLYNASQEDELINLNFNSDQTLNNNETSSEKSSEKGKEKEDESKDTTSKNDDSKNNYYNVNVAKKHTYDKQSTFKFIKSLSVDYQYRHQRALFNGDENFDTSFKYYIKSLTMNKELYDKLYNLFIYTIIINHPTFNINFDNHIINNEYYGYYWNYLLELEKQEQFKPLELNNLHKVQSQIIESNESTFKPYYNNSHIVIGKQNSENFNYELLDQNKFNNRLMYILHKLNISYDYFSKYMTLYGSIIPLCCYSLVDDESFDKYYEKYYNNSDIDISISFDMNKKIEKEFSSIIKHIPKTSDVNSNDYNKLKRSIIYKYIIKQFADNIKGNITIIKDDDHFPKYLVSNDKCKFEIIYTKDNISSNNFSFDFLRGYYSFDTKITYCYPSMLLPATQKGISFNTRWISENTTFEKLMKKYTDRGFKILCKSCSSTITIEYEKIYNKYSFMNITNLIGVSIKPLLVSKLEFVKDHDYILGIIDIETYDFNTYIYNEDLYKTIKYEYLKLKKVHLDNIPKIPSQDEQKPRIVKKVTKTRRNNWQERQRQRSQEREERERKREEKKFDIDEFTIEFKSKTYKIKKGIITNKVIRLYNGKEEITYSILEN